MGGQSEPGRSEQSEQPSLAAEEWYAKGSRPEIALSQKKLISVMGRYVSNAFGLPSADDTYIAGRRNTSKTLAGSWIT